MRTLMKVIIPVEAGNRAVSDKSLVRVIKQTIDRIHPEAVYFSPENGQRSMLMVFDMKSAADVPVLAEPLFVGLQAQVTLSPCMNTDDLEEGFAHLPDAVR